MVGVRPVTDTVKEYDGDLLGATVDRTALMCVTSPVVLPATVVAALDWLATEDLAVLVDALRERFPVRFAAPPWARAHRTTWRLDVLTAVLVPFGNSVLHNETSRTPQRNSTPSGGPPAPRPRGR